MTGRHIPLAAAALAIAGLASFAGAEPISWTEAFRGDADTTVFAAADGGLWKAPFHLAAAETLWRARPGAFVVRFRTAPDGRAVAWIARDGDTDTTSLWVGPPAPARPRVSYPSLVARDVGRMQFEPETPTTRDAMIRGGRFLIPGPQNLRHTINTVAWMPDASGLVFGYRDGLAHVSPDTGRAREVSPVRILRLHALDPAAVFLADLIAVVGGRRVEGWHLLYPAAGAWRIFPAGSLHADAVWTASTTTVWWADGDAVISIQAHDPEPRTVARGTGAIAWMRHDPASRTLHWSQGAAVWSLGETETTPRESRRFEAPITRATPMPEGARAGFQIGDALHLWSGDGRDSGRVALDGRTPEKLFEHQGVFVLVTSSRGRKLELVRWTPGGPVAREGSGGAPADLAWPSPGGAYVLLIDGGRKASDTFRAYEIATGRWSEVRNPGIIGWEPMRSW